MEIDTAVFDVIDTVIGCNGPHPEYLTAKYLDRKHPGISRDVKDVLINTQNWRDRTEKGYQKLNIFGVSLDDYKEAAEYVVDNNLYVHKPAQKALERLSKSLEVAVPVSGVSDIMLDLIVEKKFEPMIGAEILPFGTKLSTKDGYFEQTIKEIQGYEERSNIARKFRTVATLNNKLSLVIADNLSDVNLGMVEEGDYAALISNYNLILNINLIKRH